MNASAERRRAHLALTQQHQLLNRAGLSADTVTKPTQSNQGAVPLPTPWTAILGSVWVGLNVALENMNLEVPGYGKVLSFNNICVVNLNLTF